MFIYYLVLTLYLIVVSGKTSCGKIERILLNIDRNISQLEKHGISFEDAIRLVQARRDSPKTEIPVSIFSSELGPLESLVKYLKEELKLSYKEIAILLNRNSIPIGVSYRKAKSKHPAKLRLDLASDLKVPLSLFSERKFSVFESLTNYLKESLGMSFHDIAFALNRDDRTVWTVYNRFKVKNEAR